MAYEDYFRDIVGNEAIKGFLLHMLESHTVAPLLLFGGPAGAGKRQFAQALADALLCGENPSPEQRQRLARQRHPDLRWLSPEGRSGLHSPIAMRELGAMLSQPPYEAPWRVSVVSDAERMVAASANALLKAFEEPHAGNVVILVTAHPEALLPTIISRCRRLYFQTSSTPTESDPTVAAIHGKLLDLLSAGRCRSFYDLKAAVGDIAKSVEAQRQQIVDEMEGQLLGKRAAELTAIQKDEIEKEIQGVATMRYLERVEGLLATCVTWYRDLLLLAVGGAMGHLCHPQRLEALTRHVQQGVVVDLNAVQSASRECRLAIARSTPLQVCLEALLLRLKPPTY